ncbi:MAG: 3-dehydroquinate synthase II [Methanosarcinales archaeon Met12]|nr:MAG: 3-dehydroquinate synthase II [Methanosarcinales archaeon Met12]
MKGKSLWIKADSGSWEDKLAKITMGLESGADFILVDEEDIESVRELGNIRLASFSHGESDADVIVIGKNSEGDGTNPLPKDFSNSRDLNRIKLLTEKGKKTAAYVVIKGKRYEEFAVALGKICEHLIVVGTDWKIIPLENLIAALREQDVNIIAGVKNATEAKVALETLEHGADGVLLDTDDPSEIKRAANIVEDVGVKPIRLTTAKVTRVKTVGMGDRVCVDTCSLLSSGEGMLVGSQSNGLFMVHAESEESPYVASRPFRVNAGAVHAYVHTGDKTKYLSELEAGDEVLIVNSRGATKKAIIGRVKIERRPLMLIEAEVEGAKITTILQNAETIKLVTKDGMPKAVTTLKKGDEVLAYYEGGGRHFGMKIDETIVEK